MLPAFAAAFRLRVVRGFVRAVDALAREAFYGPAIEPDPGIDRPGKGL